MGVLGAPCQTQTHPNHNGRPARSLNTTATPPAGASCSNGPFHRIDLELINNSVNTEGGDQNTMLLFRRVVRIASAASYCTAPTPRALNDPAVWLGVYLGLGMH